jgi:hypothetical protein
VVCEIVAVSKYLSCQVFLEAEGQSFFGFFVLKRKKGIRRNMCAMERLHGLGAEVPQVLTSPESYCFSVISHHKPAGNRLSTLSHTSVP